MSKCYACEKFCGRIYCPYYEENKENKEPEEKK